MNSTAQEPLKAVSNIIELKPDKKYLLVFKGRYTIEELARMQHRIEQLGIKGVGIAIGDEDEIEVIEVPA